MCWWRFSWHNSDLSWVNNLLKAKNYNLYLFFHSFLGKYGIPTDTLKEKELKRLNITSYSVTWAK